MKRLVSVVALLASPTALAQDGIPLRVVVVPKVAADGQTRDAAPLEAWVHQALKDAGHRVVDLDASLQAQSFALSDAVAAGRIPDELSVLNADAAWAVQLSCDKDMGHAAVMGLSFYCTFTRKVVRIGQGDSVHAASDEWKDIFGTNFSQALFGGNVKKRAPKLLADDVATWTAEWSPAGPWDVDLKVSGLTERAQAEAIAARLREIPGMTATRLTAFGNPVSQFALRGEGGDALADLAEHIEADPGMGLRITHDTDRLIHAQVDVGSLHRRGVRILWKPPKSPRPKSEAAVVAERGPTLVRSALAGLSWIEVTDVVEKSPSTQAKADDAPYYGVVELSETREGDRIGWIATASLVSTDKGAEILAATGRDADPLAALGAAVRDLDTRFVEALGDAGRRRLLGLPESIGEALARQPIQIADLEVQALFPARTREAQTQGIGTLTLENTAKSEVRDATVELSAGEGVLATLKVPPVAPGGKATVPLKLESLPNLDPDTQHTLPLRATVSYQLDGSFGRARTYSSLVVHRWNTVDWRKPESVAAFVDAADGTVRDLATRAASSVGIDAATPELGKAAAVHAALWGPGLDYVKDPVQTSFADSIDEVQHPRQTLVRGSGDCDDLTVLLASFYEAVGLPTVIITTPGHVLVGVGSGLLAGGEVLVGLPADRFVEVDGALFVPVETTALDADFATAWTKGANLLAKATDVQAFRTRDAWRAYPTMGRNPQGDVRVSVRSKPDKPTVPQLSIPKQAPSGAAPLGAHALAWLEGDRKQAMKATGELCDKGVGEACFNLAVMLEAAGSADAQVATALTILPPPVMSMLLDDWGGGMADDQSDDESAEEAEMRRKLEEILRNAREQQQKLESEGVTSTPLQTGDMAGRRGSDVGKSKARSFAPMFFYRQASGD